MGFPRDEAGRVSQSKYWALFGAYMLAVPVLLIGGIVSLASSGVGVGLLMIAAIVPLGMYWRVIMMRRCRDIGWPTFLPWLSFGLQSLSSLSIRHAVLSGAAPALSLLLVPLLIAFADFAFSIVIGCIRTKDSVDYEAVFGDGPEPFRDARPASAIPAGYDAPDRFDAAIARALEAHRRGESILDPAPAARPAPAMPARPASGFGRRVI
jgi:uncharacterized membrane protein YhaH (DUF805 family)